MSELKEKNKRRRKDRLLVAVEGKKTCLMSSDVLQPKLPLPLSPPPPRLFFNAFFPRCTLPATSTMPPSSSHSTNFFPNHISGLFGLFSRSVYIHITFNVTDIHHTRRHTTDSQALIILLFIHSSSYQGFADLPCLNEIDG